jgi:steroid 5-alpha reductase family enzyme
MRVVPPLHVSFWILIGICAVTWVLSLITREHSWVDRIWSVIPVVYVWVFAAAAGLGDGRLTLMAGLVTLWGIRLTFNFARKGGYARGGEDYRWKYLRARMPRALFEVFNLLFIVCYQNVLLLLIALPAYTAWQHRRPLTVLDWVIAAAFLAALAGETVADQQQWNFQQWKRAERDAGREPAVRFVQTGLFRVSRHPNFFFEQAQWWLLFFLGCVAASSLWQWTVIGPALLIALFVGSTRFTEQISRERYPEYADYQARVSPLVPWFPRRGAGGPREDLTQPD